MCELSSSIALEIWTGADILGSAVYGARKSASLPREMELEVEIEQVFKRVARDRANRALADICEHRVQQLAEQRRAVYRSQTYVAFCFSAEGKSYGVHVRIFEKERDLHVQQL